MTQSPPKRAALFTLGCRLNQAETAIMAERLQAAGYTLVPFDEAADLGVINTCTVTGEADAKSRKAIRAFIRRNPSAFVAVVGCYSQVKAEDIARISGVDIVLGNREKLDLLDYVAECKKATPVVQCDQRPVDDFRIGVASSAPLTRRVNLKIQDGCGFCCTYCIVPRARGGPRSRAFDDLANEACALVERGAKEIVLTGVNVGAYECSGKTLLEVVDRLNEIDGLRRIRISSIEPTTIPDGLLGRMRDPAHALVPFLHIPLQAGCNRTLAAMRRPYSAGESLTFLRRAEAAVPDLCIGTDILVGFPGETEADFEATCRFVDESPIAYAHVFKYSDREGAPAAQLSDKIDAKTLSRRSTRMRQISREKRRAFNGQYLGRTIEVLFEDCESGSWQGYTGNYMRVAACSDENLENEIRPVTLREVCGDLVLGDVNA